MRVLGATSVACVGDVFRWSERVSRTAHVLRHGRSSWKMRRACSNRFSAGGARANVGYRSDNGSDNARTEPFFCRPKKKRERSFKFNTARRPESAMNSRFRLFRDLDSDGDGTLSYKVRVPPSRLSRPQRPVPPCSSRPKDFLLTPLVLNFFPFRAGGGGGTEAQGRRGVR